MAIPQSTIITWLGTGLDADLPDATDFNDNLAAGATARYYAYNTEIDYVLNRDTVSWDAIGGVGGSSAVAGSSGDIQTNSSGSFGALTPGTGVSTFLATPSSANLRAALTDETGTGEAVFATSPTLVTPVLGTPSSGDASNLTNIPVANATGILGATHGGAGAVTGILKANGSGTVSAATAGTDYAAAPSGSANTPLFDDGSGGFTNGTRHGDTLDVATVDGATTVAHLAVWDGDGNLVDGGTVPAGGSGGIGDVTGGGISTDGELAAYNGTGGDALKQSFAKISGPASTVKTYTLPNASAAILTDNAAVTVAQGGTGATSAGGAALDNITGFSSTGILARTGSATYAQRTITAGKGIAVTNGSGAGGNPTVALANDAVATAQWVSGAVVANGTIYFAYKCPFAGTIASLDYFAGNGSFTVAIKINGTNVTSLSAVTVNSATPANTAASGANTVAINDIITGVISSATGSPTDAVLSLNITRT